MFGFDLLESFDAFAGHPWILSLIIFVSTFILEDVATFSAAVLASHQKIPVSMAYMALLSGIVLGDLGLYWLGYGASRFEWAQNILHRKRVELVNKWLDEREVMAVVIARFIPGARFATYTAMGFFHLSFAKFTMAVIGASVVWTSFLFAVILIVGEVFIDQMAVWRWPVTAFVLFLVLVVPRVIHSHGKKKMS